jgi:hypothetical protein
VLGNVNEEIPDGGRFDVLGTAEYPCCVRFALEKQEVTWFIPFLTRREAVTELEVGKISLPFQDLVEKGWVGCHLLEDDGSERKGKKVLGCIHGRSPDLKLIPNFIFQIPNHVTWNLEP